MNVPHQIKKILCEYIQYIQYTILYILYINIKIIEMSVTEIQIVYDSTHMRYIKKSNIYKQRVEWQLPVGGGKGKLGVTI